MLSGIRDMRRLPGIIFVVDTIKEHIAIAEGRRLRIPIGAIVDTNCDPDVVDYPIPGNDDAIKSVQLIARAVSDAIMEESANIAEAEIIEQETAKAASAPAEETEVAEGAVEETEETKKKPRVIHKKIVKFAEEE